MIINGSNVHGIFIFEPSDKVTRTEGDLVFHDGILWKVIKEVKGDIIPSDSEYFEASNPNISTLDNLINSDKDNGIVLASTLRKYLYGEDGILNHLRYSSDIEDVTIITLSENENPDNLLPGTTYIVNNNQFNTILVNENSNAILNTFIAGDQIIQLLIETSAQGTIASTSIRNKPINGNYGNFITLTAKTLNDTITNNYLKLNSLYRSLFKFLANRFTKYDLVADLGEGVIEHNFSDITNNNTDNIKIQLTITKTINGVTRQIIKWYEILNQDIWDSNWVKLHLELSDDYELYLEKSVLKLSNIKIDDAKITKIIKYIGDVSENSDGSDSYDFRIDNLYS